jgi:alkylation response protein AidB-like acyl-CoA dehydrogenase
MAIDTPVKTKAAKVKKQDWVAVANKLGPKFAERAAAHDEGDSFVAENYDDLRAANVLGAPGPAALGGGDATPGEVAEMLRTFAHYCSSTALALSMHMHLVTVPAWRFKHENGPVGPLERVAKEQIVLVSTGGADWLDGTGEAIKVEGGYRVNGHKIFCSGSPIGDVLMTTAVVDDPDEGLVVQHMGIPLNAEGVEIQDNWRVLGMRGTGSNDILLKDVFVPEAAAPLRRPKGEYHHFIHIVAKIAIPIVYSVYLGVAEAARDKALELIAKRRDNAGVQILAGELENQLRGAQLAVREMRDIADNAEPSMETTNRVFIARALAERGSIGATERAFQLSSGAGFFRKSGLERLFRDVQGARFHPLQEMPQRQLAGRLALGLPPL